MVLRVREWFLNNTKENEIMTINIFDKLNDKMDIATRTTKNLGVEKNEIYFEIDGFGAKIVNSERMVTVMIAKINSNGQFEINNRVEFDNDKEDTELNLSPRFFYVECKKNIDNFENYGKALFSVLNEVESRLTVLISDMQQSEKSFLSNFNV